MKVNKHEVFAASATNVVFGANRQYSPAQTQFNPRMSECGSKNQDVDNFLEEKSFDEWSELLSELQSEGWKISQLKNISFNSSGVWI